ncbi:MAG: KH domain-containing protein [Acidimicrobiales bacterium]
MSDDRPPLASVDVDADFDDDDDDDDEFDGELGVDDDDDDDDGEAAGGAGNRVVGGTARSVLEYVARAIVDEPDGVVIEADEGRGRVSLRLHVAPGDMGKVIGRRGRVAIALRTVVRAAGAQEGVDAAVDIVD